MAATNEVQTITLSGTPQAGTFTINFNGQVTDPIAWNADAGAITAALEALSNVGVGGINVSISGAVITLTLQGNLRYQDQPEVTCTSNLYIPAKKGISFSAGVASGIANVKPDNESASTTNDFGAGASLAEIASALNSGDWSGKNITVTGDWSTGFTFTFNIDSEPPIMYQFNHAFTDGSVEPVTVTPNDSVQAYAHITLTVATTTEGVAPPVTLSVDNTTISENAGEAIVTATLTESMPFDATVTLTLTGTAQNTVDYNVSDTVITIPAGDTTGAITVTAINDAVNDNGETVILSITDTTMCVEETPQSVTVTIQQGGVTVDLTSSTTSIVENGGAAYVTAVLSQTSSTNITVSFTFTGSATQTVDYTPSTNSLIITSGNTSGSISITALSDTIHEGNQTVVVDFSLSSGAKGSTTSIVIVDDDPQPTVNLSRSATTIAENGGTGYVTASLSNPSVDNVIIDFTASGAVLNTDYTLSSNSLIVTAGNTSGSISITALNDSLAEGNQTVIFDFSVTNGIKGSTTSVTIVDDDPLITLDSDVTTFHEANDVATIFAYSSFTRSGDIIVDLAFDGTATDVDDYSRSGSSITIPSGSTSGSIQVVALVDAVSDPNETIIISIDTVTNGAESGTQSLTLTILEVSNTPTPPTLPGLGYKIGLGL